VSGQVKLLEKLQRLKIGLMQDLFSGRVSLAGLFKNGSLSG